MLSEPEIVQRRVSVLVTGASRGIGRALARLYASRGCDLALTARNLGALDELRAEALALGAGKVVVAEGDVTHRKDLEGVIGGLIAELGGIDIVFVNAGVSVPTEGDKFDVQAYVANIDTNLLGAIYTLGSVIPDMVQRRRGHVVGVSSLASFTAMPSHAAYSASKGALNLILQGLRVDLHKYGIHVTTVCPGFVDTDMARRLGDNLPFFVPADAAAEIIARAVDRKKAYCIFPWQMAWIIRVVRLLPEWVVNLGVRRIFGRARHDRQAQVHP